MAGAKTTILLWLVGFLLLTATACDDDAPPTDIVDTEDAGDDSDAELDVVSDLEDTDAPEDSDIAAEVDLPPDEIMCRPCTSPLECGGPGNLCLYLPSGESVCTLDCSADETACPDGTFCATVEGDDVGDEPAQQCLPDQLFCNNQCGDPPRECDEEGDICDPLTGRCGPPKGLCEPCDIDFQCGEGNLCLTFPDIDEYRGCGRDCSAGEPDCPSGYACALVDEANNLLQCIPETLTCIDRCSDVVCDEGLACDPLTGECVTPLELCDACMTHAQCGGPTDLCITLLDGGAHCSVDCGATAELPGECPPGYLCYPLGGAQQCLPTLLTCVDHCQEPEPVECDPGQNCDVIDGTCHAPQVNLCQKPCDNNYECGGQEDMCVSIEGDLGGPFCSMDCDSDNPCPIGYSCGQLNDNLRQQCVPSNHLVMCSDCSEITCPDGEACRPVDGSCLPLPQTCADHEECPDGELCDYWEDRCTPVGLACLYNYDSVYGFAWTSLDCDSATTCTATSMDMEGICAQDFWAATDGCPDTAPAAEAYDRIYSRICVERGLGGVERCGRLMPLGSAVGRPCPSYEDSTGCGLTADVCLTDVIDGIPGFCSTTCDPTAENACPNGEICTYVPDTIDAFCLPSECECMALPDLDVGEIDAFQAALDQLALTRCDIATYAAERSAAGLHVVNDPFRIELAGLVRNEALFGARAVRDMLGTLAQDSSLSSAILLASANLDREYHSVEPTPDFSAVTFCEAVIGLYAGSGETPPTCDDLATSETDIPANMMDGLAQVIAAADWAAMMRNSISPSDVTSAELDALLDSLHRLLLPDGTAPPDAYAWRNMLIDYKIEAVYEAAATLASVIESAALIPASGDPISTDFVLDTPLGLVVVQGDADHTYCNDATECAEVTDGVVLTEPVLLLIDIGGNDTYLIPAGATRGYEHAVSVFIDLGGNDLYSYTTSEETGPGELLPPADSAGRLEAPAPPLSLSLVGRQGASRGGIGFLFDWGQGADVYQSLRMSQGFGMLGVGALVDDGCIGEAAAICSDELTSESLSQGAGLFGIGIVSTGDNDNIYQGLFAIQGAGGPMGAGLLLDASGDDRYIAHPGDAENIWVVAPAFSGLGNWSAAQGAGIGVPSDPPEAGGNISGGLGVLIDLAGVDDYRAGITAQAAGYWHGIGILVEGDDDDGFESLSFAQGSGRDFGVGVLAEQGGNDTYNGDPDVEQSVLGSGYNFGVGLVVEESGSDIYSAGADSIGTGYLNGSGVFVDNGGNDTYSLDSLDTLGKAILSLFGYEPLGNPRRLARTVGVFVDANGADTYTGRLDTPAIADDSAWVQRAGGPAGETLIEYGVGADGEGGTGVSTIE